MRSYGLKQAFRSNRLIGLLLLIYGLLAYGQVANDTGFETVGAGLQWVFLPLSSFVYLVVNEAILRKGKTVYGVRSDTSQGGFLHNSLPWINAGFMACLYTLTGQVGVLFAALMGMGQAQLLGRTRSAWGLAIVWSLVIWGSRAVDYPFLLGKFPLVVSSDLLLMLWLPLVIVFNGFMYSLSGYLQSVSNQVNKLQSLAATDALTGLVNRRQFNHQLDAEIARARRYRKPLSLALFDIDDFKKINDVYGHQIGDRILRELGALISVNVRESDIPARYGGEEFALILPETAQMDAQELLERLRAMVEHTVFCLPDRPLTATISVGVAQLDLQQRNKAHELIEKADIALYEAKKLGKNRVVYGIIPPPKNLHPVFGRPSGR